MAYAIELLFDPVTTASVRSAWTRLADTSGNPCMVDKGVYPHVALAGFEADPLPPDLTVLLGELAAELQPETLLPTGIGRFEGQEPVVFIGFEACPFLKQTHGHVQAILDQLDLPNHEYYRDERWVPHCTLAMKFSPSRLAATLEAAASHTMSMPCQVTEIGLIQYPPTELLWHRPFAGGPTGRSN